MRLSNIVAASAVGATGALAQSPSTNAVVVEGNPSNRAFIATLPEEPFFQAGSLDGNVQGYVSARAGPGGVGVTFEVSFSNLPTEGGPFTYHLHDQAVPANGNCTATRAHLDPFGRGEDTPCDATQPETCQVGDNSGKYGKITSDPYFVSYHDPYSSLREDIHGSYFGDRSFVFHFANKTRISCANFTPLNGTAPYPTASTYPTASVYPTGTGYPTSIPSTTGAPAPSATVPIAAGNALSAAKGLIIAPIMALLLLW
jgi:hypothetical protein